MHITIKVLVVLFWTFLFTPSLAAQSSGPYHLSIKRELIYLGGGAISFGLGEHLRSKVPELTFMDLEEEEVNQFDQVATTFSSEKARLWSDHTLYASAGLSGSSLFSRASRREFGKISVLFVEVMLLNAGLTNISKSIFQRPRPYVFDENWDPVRILSSNDRAAFVSGHTSGAAAGAFFFARVFSDYYPKSKLKPYVWGLAIGMPALTGYLRVRAGRHYPTDVIAGYLLGGSIGYFVPLLHKKPTKKSRLTFAPTGAGLYLSYKW